MREIHSKPNPIKQINQLYDMHDRQCGRNVVGFQPPLTPTGEGIINDVIALLEDPEYRWIAQPALEDTLQKITRKILD